MGNWNSASSSKMVAKNEPTTNSVVDGLSCANEYIIASTKTLPGFGLLTDFVSYLMSLQINLLFGIIIAVGICIFAILLWFYYYWRTGIFGTPKREPAKFPDLRALKAPLRLIQSHSMIDIPVKDIVPPSSVSSFDADSGFFIARSGSEVNNHEDDYARRANGVSMNPVSLARVKSGFIDGMVDNFLKTRFRSELNRPRWMKDVEKQVKNAMTSYKERQKFKQVKKFSEKGDGLSSIYDNMNRMGSFSTLRKTIGDDIEHQRDLGLHRTSNVDLMMRHASDMDMEPKSAFANILRLHSAFAWLPTEVTELLAVDLQVINPSDGAVIYKAGDVVSFFFLVLHGQINGFIPAIVSDGNMKPKPDFEMHRGERATCESELLLLLLNESFTSVVTLVASERKETEKTCRIVKIPSKALRLVCDKFPGLLQEWCNRILVKLDRITFFTISSLTRYALFHPPDHSILTTCQEARLLNARKEFNEIQSAVLTDENMEFPGLLALLSEHFGVDSALLKSEVRFSSHLGKTGYQRFPKKNGGRRGSLAFVGRSTSAPPYKIKSGKVNLKLFEIPAEEDVLAFIGEASYVIVLEGELSVCSPVISTADERDLMTMKVTSLQSKKVVDFETQFIVKPGQSFGHFSIITNASHLRYTTKQKLGRYTTSKMCVLNKAHQTADENGSVKLLHLSEEGYFALLEKFPEILTIKAKQIAKDLLNPSVRQLDNALKWKSYQAGDFCLKSDTKNSDVSVVLHGRLACTRSVYSKERTSIYPNKPKVKRKQTTLQGLVLGSMADRWKTVDSRAPDANLSSWRVPRMPSDDEGSIQKLPGGLQLTIVRKSPEKEVPLVDIGRGEMFGEMNLLSNKVYPMNIIAERYSQVANIPLTVVKEVVFKYPKAMLQLGSKMVDRLDAVTNRAPNESKVTDKERPRVITVIPSSVQVNVELFLHIMLEVFKTFDVKVQVLNSSLVSQIVHASSKGYFKENNSRLATHVTPFPTDANTENLSRVANAFDSFSRMEDILEDEEPSTGEPSSLCHCSIGLKDSLTREDEDLVFSIINEVEEVNDIVFLIADSRMCPLHKTEPSWWSQLCAKQSDLILQVANAKDDPAMTLLEWSLTSARLGRAVKHELVLLHFPSTTSGMHKDAGVNFQVDQFDEPKNTKSWIQNRPNISQHHHLRVHLYTGVAAYDQSLETRESGYQEKIGPSYTNHHNIYHYKSDFRRLGRWLINQSVALVLGGGGARGVSHLSVIRVLEEKGIPIDMISGTSIGAFMGALYAWKTDHLLMYQPLARFCNEMSSIPRKLLDLTWPVISYFSGNAFNKGIIRIFEDRKIEDLWLPYFCITTDLTDSCQLVHRNGSLWRYVRASMTLVSFLPPICDLEVDPIGKQKPRVHYLCDGGYVNNLPVDAMRSLTGNDNVVIAVDVQSDWSIEGDDYGDQFFGFYHMMKSFNPFAKTPNIPTHLEIQTQLAFIASVQQGSVGKIEDELEEDLADKMAEGQELAGAMNGKSERQHPAKFFDQGPAETDAQKKLRQMIDLFLHPPVEQFGTLEFNKSREIQFLGLQYSEPAIEGWLENFKSERGRDIMKYFGTLAP